MKLLIIAGPYEADRIRRAAVSADLEAVAVEPGESLSGWITATRPDVIILAPQIVNADPVVALGKVRAVPRGRVPIFLVGDAEERDMLEPLADGFFVRPLQADELVARARAVQDIRGGGAVTSVRAHDEASSPGSGPQATPRPTPLKPLVAARPVAERQPTMFDRLSDNIEADFDAEIRAAVRAVGALRPAPDPRPLPVAAHGDEGIAELKDESSQKTLEVPHDVSTARGDGQRPGAAPLAAAGAVQLAAADEVDLDLPSLLARMYLSRLSGRLTLQHDGVVKAVVFERGHPVLASSTRVEDRMGQMLIRHGRFTAEQIAACGSEVAASGRRLGAVLVDRGLIKASDLSLLVRRHYEDIIYSLFSWERGVWNLGTDHSAAGEKILLSQHPAALILEGIRRKYSAARALGGLGGADRVLRLRLTSGASDLLEKMGISSEERNLVLLLDGVRSLGEIRALTAAVPERLYGVAWALFVLERLDANDAFGAEVSSATGHPAPAPPGGRARDAAIDRALVLARHALVEEGDYFQVLGVARDASAQEIRRAHEVLAAELAPEALHPTVASELVTQLADIRLVLAEAARLMSNDRLRQRYRAALPPPSAAAAAGAAPVAPGPSESSPT